jgi:hypothetical protein
MGEANHNPVGWGTTIVFLDDDAINDEKPYPYPRNLSRTKYGLEFNIFMY